MSSVGRSSRPATWGNGRRGKTPEYEYSTLEEIYDEKFTASTLCNVYGIVADFKEPSKSRGSDYFALVFIVDKTSRQPLKIRTFHRDSSFFPTVHLGDIIRFHRLKVYKPSSDITDALLMSTKGWSWVLWRKSPFISMLDDGISSSDSYTLLDSDKEIVEELRTWQDGIPPEKLARPNGHIKNMRLSNVKHGDHFSLLCQVIVAKKVTEFHVAIKAWDGTKPAVHFEPITAFAEGDEAAVAKDIPADYIVDISIHDDHAATWSDLAPSEGSFVLFHDLHAWPNPDLDANSNATKNRWGASELVLHSGAAFGRGVRKVGADEKELLPEVMRDIGTAKAFLSGDKAEQSQNTKNTLDLLQVLHSEAVVETGMEPQQEESSEDVIPRCSTGKQTIATEEYATAASSLSSEAEPADTVEESPGELRCLQESATVVTGGDGIPQKLTNLKEVKNCNVPLQQSKFFRVRVQIEACVTPEDSYVKHFCPVTGIFFKATKSGEPLTLSEEIGNFVKAWRKVRGIDEGSADANADNDGQADVPNSQWDIPESVGGTKPVNIKRYECEKDGSTWESIETDDHITRKRKLGQERFTIMYKCSASPDYSSGSLRTWGSTYNRVIRHVPFDLQLSENPPPVAFQKGVFYYGCPAYAVKPTVPTLKLEAESFNESRVTHAMGTPALVPRLMLSFTLKDESGRLEKVWLMGKDAVNFFGGITPQEYLLDEDGCRESLKQTVTSLGDLASWVECIVEKKSRQRKDGSDEPYYIYSICNTKVKE